MTVNVPGRRRADAVRNAQTIVRAATELLSRDPQAPMTAVAVAAGVGRVTLYAHFPSRRDLVEAVLVHVLEQGGQALDGLDLEAEPVVALRRMVASGWQQLDRVRTVLVAAQSELDPQRIRELHAPIEDAVAEVVRQGQLAGQIRTDQPTGWLLAVMHAVIHGAAEEVSAGRLDPALAEPLIWSTLLSAYDPVGVRS